MNFKMKNAFTVDLEDWYQGIMLPIEEWHKYEKRLYIGTDRLLKLLKNAGVKATFFILAKIIEDHPEIIRQIIDEGHEIGCHTYTHIPLFEMNAVSFETEIKKCNLLLADHYGIHYKGFRAPFFSIDHRSLWAMDVLKRNGYEYDSSIYPGDNKRTGIVGYRKDIHELDNKLIEAPLTTFKVLKFDVGLGGAYFRLLPYSYFRKKLLDLNKQHINGIFYIHPWELDPAHPYLKQLPPRLKYPHYLNLKSTESKIKRLLSDFEFVSLSEIISTRNAK